MNWRKNKMKKRRYLKKWVEVVLAFIMLASLVVMGAEAEKYFIISKIIALVIFALCGYLLVNYTKYE
jgi:membrane-anchored glycerophosphoryl diester phosphodiesterase (GDPDase)